MAFQKPKKAPKFRDLIAILNQAKGVDNALYQTIQEIINRLEQLVAVGQEAVDSVAPFVASGGGGGGPVTPPTPDPYSLDYLGDYNPPTTYNDGDIVVGPDGITYVCTKDGVLTPPEPWPPGTAPTLHHTTHEPGGGDAMEVDAIPTRGSLRTLGSGPNQAAPGNDTRFTNARPPTAHAATHQPAGSDPLLNNAWLPTNNTFTGPRQKVTAATPRWQLEDSSQGPDQRKFEFVLSAGNALLQALNDAETASPGIAITMGRAGDVAIGRNLVVTYPGNVTMGSYSGIVGPNHLLTFYDNTVGLDLKRWRMLTYGDGHFRLEALNDANTVVSCSHYFSRAGDVYLYRDIYEKGRPTAIGHWVDVPFNAANFSALGSMTFVVASGNVVINRYCLIGKTMIWNCYIGGATLGGAASNTLLINIPGGMTVPLVNAGGGTTMQLYDSRHRPGYVTPVNGNQVKVMAADEGNYVPNPSGTFVRFVATLEIN